MRAFALVAVVAAAALLQVGCGGEEKERDESRAATQRRDPPARPPPGWRTVTNASAGFTISVPRSWSATTTPRRTVLRSDDRLVAISISADRSAPGRELPANEYARRTLRTLPGFAGVVGKGVSRVNGSGYETAVVTATGTVNPSNLSQRISVAIFHLPGQMTYGALVFRNAGVEPRFNDSTIERVLRSFRAQPPNG